MWFVHSIDIANAMSGYRLKICIYACETSSAEIERNHFFFGLVCCRLLAGWLFLLLLFFDVVVVVVCVLSIQSVSFRIYACILYMKMYGTKCQRNRFLQIRISNRAEHDVKCETLKGNGIDSNARQKEGVGREIGSIELGRVKQRACSWWKLDI